MKYLSSERINRLLSYLSWFKGGDSSMRYLNLCHCKDSELKIDYNIAVKSTALFFNFLQVLLKSCFYVLA